MPSTGLHVRVELASQNELEAAIFSMPLNKVNNLYVNRSLKALQNAPIGGLDTRPLLQRQRKAEDFSLLFFFFK